MRTNVKTCLKVAPGIFILFILLFIFIFKYLTYYARDGIVHLGNTRELGSQIPISVQTSTDSNFLNDPPTYDDQVSFFPFKDVLVRSVYFDDRPRDGHRNTSVFIVLIRKNITDNHLVVGCQVGKHRAKEFKVNVIGETPKWRAYPQYNVIDHEEVLVDCFDLPVWNGTSAYLFYRLYEGAEVDMAVSERPLVIPPPRLPPWSPDSKFHNFTIVTCTKIFGTPPWFIEWMEYQRRIGVDHVHLNVDDAFTRNAPVNILLYVKKAMKEGFVSADPWVPWLQNGKEVWYHNQGLILEDCIYRFRTSYDFIFILDTDDFFVPRNPDEKTLHYYIKKHCMADNTGSCKFRWVEFYPDHYGLTSEPTIGGNMTARLKNFTHYVQPNRKSLHRIDTVVDTCTHHAHKMLPGYRSIDVPQSSAYVGHIRKGKHPNFDKKKPIVSVAKFP